LGSHTRAAHEDFSNHVADQVGYLPAAERPQSHGLSEELTLLAREVAQNVYSLVKDLNFRLLLLG
jgi:hypothetical protein